DARQCASHGVGDGLRFRKAAVAGHRVNELVRDANVEGAALPRDELDRRKLAAEFVHEGLREVERLRLVPALGAVRDLDLDRAHRTGCAATSSRSSRCTSAFANAVVSSRIFWSSACSRARTSSASWSTGASGEPNSGCAAKISRRLRARSSLTEAGRSIQWPSSRKRSSKKAMTGMDLYFP